MFPGKLWSLLFCLLMFSVELWADDDLVPVDEAAQPEVTATESQTKEKPAPKKVRVIKTRIIKKKLIRSWSLGGSYMLWNEDLKISQSGADSKGFANYGGFGLSLEYSKLGRRWLQAGGIAFGFGKASSGGFDSGIAFADGVNRSWWSLQASAALYYRINTTYMVGPGILWRQRTVDWKPADSTITVTKDSQTKLAPQILLRWRISDSFTFIQAYTLLNIKNSTMWTWTAQIDL